MDLCDEMGLMVDDEAFDMWEQKKQHSIIVITLRNGVKEMQLTG
jgi:beta-galactosidase/beta-glucuronidase